MRLCHVHILHDFRGHPKRNANTRKVQRDSTAIGSQRGRERLRLPITVAAVPRPRRSGRHEQQRAPAPPASRVRDAASSQDDLSLLRHCVSRSWWPAARELVARAHRREAAGALRRKPSPRGSEGGSPLRGASRHTAWFLDRLASSPFRLREVSCQQDPSRFISTVSFVSET